MDLYDKIVSTAYLGEEFLTWLWFRSERDEGEFELEGEQTIELWFDNQLTLEANLAEAERSRLTGGSPSVSPEAKEALRRGKRVAQAKLRLGREGREWVFSITAKTLALGGIKTPAVLAKEEDNKFYERMDLVDEVEACMRALFGLFLEKRLDTESWQEEMIMMRTWLHQGE